MAVKTYNVAAEHNNFKPKNLEELKQSLPYAVAISLVVGEVDIDKLNRLVDYGLFENYSTVDKVNSIKNLVNKMIILSDDKLNELYPNKRPSNVIIKLDDEFRNGIFQNITFIPKGDFENPYDLSELIDKFKSLNPDYNINNLVIIDEIVNFNSIGVTLTTSAMMHPYASVSGFMISLSQAQYFSVGKIDSLQLADYAARRHMSNDEIKKYIQCF